MMEEAGLIDAVIVGETGFDSSDETRGVLVRAFKASTIVTDEADNRRARTPDPFAAAQCNVFPAPASPFT